ncbi:proton-conducting transporter membrane subunit, partial [Salmonella enterica]|uniref:proton-conducting transporter transmembrane domain-containing protein n=1 Tax=Salmonella enterica TaxID=28901 RepID=UPI00398C745F
WGGLTALGNIENERRLAYCTRGPVGHSFLALGVLTCDAALFHLLTHAFYKARLFLASGSVILACHHAQNIFKMGGLRKSIPLVYACFLVGVAALSALPLCTAVFFSKDDPRPGPMSNALHDLRVVGRVLAVL